MCATEGGHLSGSPDERLQRGTGAASCQQSFRRQRLHGPPSPAAGKQLSSPALSKCIAMGIQRQLGSAKAAAMLSVEQQLHVSRVIAAVPDLRGSVDH